MIISILLFFLLIFSQTHGKFVFNSQNSSIIVLRHIRLTTDNEYYRIRCPYHLKHLTLTLLNYSTDNCFDLYTKSINQACINYRSPCRFHAKTIQLDCDNRPYSNHVDITYQCSFLPSISMNTTDEDNHNITSLSTSPFDSMTLHALSFPSNSFGIEESIGIFLIGMTVVFILWLTVCCVWFIRCDRSTEEDDGKCELISIRPYLKSDLSNFTILSERKSMIVGNLSGHTNTGGLENVCLHINPLENRRISSLKITQID